MFLSSEMLTLLKNILLLVDFDTPEDDEHWELLVLLKQIVNYTTALHVHAHTYLALKEIIVSYLKFLSEWFPGRSRPKHHHLLHYPRCMQLCGPLWKLSCIRGEGKHQESNLISRNSISRVNVCQSISIRHQLMFNYRFMCPEIETKTFLCGSPNITPVVSSNYNKLLFDKFPKNLDDPICLTSFIKHNDKILKKNSVIVEFAKNINYFYFVNTFNQTWKWFSNNI